MKFSDVSRDKSLVFGLTLILISAVIGYATTHHGLFLILLGLVAVCIASPQILKPFAFVFYSITKAVGKILSMLVLSVVFLLVITPMGLLKRLLGHDFMRSKEWKKDKGSTFIECDHLYSPKDMEKTF